MTSIARAERGIALALALGVLVVTAALVAVMFFVGFQEARMGQTALRLERALGVAEEGAAEVIRTWDPTVYNQRLESPLDSAAVPAGYPNTWAAAQHGTGAYGGYVYKLNGELYYIDIVGRDSPPPGSAPAWPVRQRVGLLTHVRPVASGVTAALTAGGATQISGSTRVDGNDRVPPGWGACGPADSAKAGIRAGGAVSTSGVAAVAGQPPSTRDSTVPPVADLQGLTYGRLAQWATHTLPGRAFGGEIGPVVLSGRCLGTVATNWGNANAPGEPCSSYFPVVHVAGDATMSGLQGQGILLVDGSLVVRGAFTWVGVALIRGNLSVVADASGDVAMRGAVLVNDSVAVEGRAGGSVEITYSKCAISKALESVATVSLLRAQSWVSLSDEP